MTKRLWVCSWLWLVLPVCGWGQTTCEYCGIYQPIDSGGVALSVFLVRSTIIAEMQFYNTGGTSTVAEVLLNPISNGYAFTIASRNDLFGTGLSQMSYIIEQGDKGTVLFNGDTAIIHFHKRDIPTFSSARKSTVGLLSYFIGDYKNDSNRCTVLLDRHKLILSGSRFSVTIDTLSVKFAGDYEGLFISGYDSAGKAIRFSNTYNNDSYCTSTELSLESYTYTKLPFSLLGKTTSRASYQETNEELYFECQSGIISCWYKSKKVEVQLLVEEINIETQSLVVVFPQSRSRHLVQYQDGGFLITNPDGSTQLFTCFL